MTLTDTAADIAKVAMTSLSLIAQEKVFPESPRNPAR